MRLNSEPSQVPTWRIVPHAVVLLLIPHGLLGQSPPVVTARPASMPITLGRGTAGSEWQAADSITVLRQREPNVGETASERTVVRLLRDTDALFVWVRAYDSDMSQVRANEYRRDADLSGDDNIELLIDGFYDRRGAFVFGTNPNGAMWDAQLVDLDDVNANWNGVWDVAVTRDALGWSAVFRIPYATLRFHSGADRIGLNVRRFIRRKNEEDLWCSWGRAQGLYQLQDEGELQGLQGLTRSGQVELYPYALGRLVEPTHDSLGVRTGSGFAGGEGGLDVKAALSPTLTGDLTVNTDFAEVEADSQVINLTRVPFFFPEKREFFLESSGLFDFATPGKDQAFYSRRIGLDSSGAPVPMVAGGRLYGREGPWRVGLIDVQTGGADQANDAVLRVQHDLFDRSFIGAVGTLRAASGHGSEATGGLDLDLPLVIRGQNLEPHFWLMGTHTPGIPGTPVAWRISADNPNDLFDNFISLYRIDPGFNPALGFAQRTGIWETTGHVDFQPRPHALGIRQFDFVFPIPTWDIVANRTGSLGRTDDWQAASFQWQLFNGDRENGDHFELNVQRLMDGPSVPFAIFRALSIPAGRYWWSRYEVQYFQSPGRTLTLGGLVNWGGFYGGRSADVQLSGTVRGGGHATLGLALTRTAARLPVGGFTALLWSGRLEYNFNTRTSLLGFFQYTNDERRMDFNLRFHWIPAVGDDVFLVWNSGYTTNPAAVNRFPSLASLSRQVNGALEVKVVHRLAF